MKRRPLVKAWDDAAEEIADQGPVKAEVSFLSPDYVGQGSGSAPKSNVVLAEVL